MQSNQRRPNTSKVSVHAHALTTLFVFVFDDDFIDSRASPPLPLPHLDRPRYGRRSQIYYTCMLRIRVVCLKSVLMITSHTRTHVNGAVWVLVYVCHEHRGPFDIFLASPCGCGDLWLFLTNQIRPLILSF